MDPDAILPISYLPKYLLDSVYVISILKSSFWSTTGWGTYSAIVSNKSKTPSLFPSKDLLAHPSLAAAYIVG
jgi:hypothetical protein